MTSALLRPTYRVLNIKIPRLTPISKFAEDCSLWKLSSKAPAAAAPPPVAAGGYHWLACGELLCLAGRTRTSLWPTANWSHVTNGWVVATATGKATQEHCAGWESVRFFVLFRFVSFCVIHCALLIAISILPGGQTGSPCQTQSRRDPKGKATRSE